MKEQKQLPKTLKLGACELDVPSGIVVDGDRTTRLDPKSVDLAIFLVEHAAQLVTHDQLLDAVWPNKFVSESQLSKRITEIRKALGDSQKPHRYIETLPKRGYRLVCQCEIVGDAVVNKQAIAAHANSAMGGNDQAHSSLASSSPQPTVEIPGSKYAGGDRASLLRRVAIGMLVIALGYFIYESRFNQETVFDAAAVAEKSVAVLPFDDLSSDGSYGWYSTGLADEISKGLSRLPELRVPSRTSSSQFRGKSLGTPEIAEKLGVAYVLEGSVSRDGDRLRIMAQLIRAEDGYQMWAESYNGSTEEVFDFQRDVAESIATVLDIYLDDERRELMFQIGTRNVEAYEAYLKGVDTHSNSGAGSSLTMWDANVYFERAMQLDPEFAAAALMHHDAFAYVLRVGNTHHRLNGVANPMYSQEAAVEFLMADLDQAIANTSDSSLRLAAEMNREFFSSSWHQMPALIERLREQMDSDQWSWTGHSWVEEILGFFGEYEMLRSWGEERLRADPLDSGGWGLLYFAEIFSKSSDTWQELLSRARAITGNPNWGRRMELYRAQHIGNREGVIAWLESYLEDSPADGSNKNWHKGFLAAVRGEYEEARRYAMQAEASRPVDGNMVHLLVIYHETGDEALSRALIKKIDALPGGAMVFAEQSGLLGKSLPFDLADAPNFVAQLKQAGIDPGSFGILPHLSK